MIASDNHYDVIVIGSGMGALSCASILSQQYHKKVLVLERHFKLGGFTHIFKRKGKYVWDVGLHYVGGMGAGEMSRAVFDYVTGGGVTWQEMPDVYDVFVYPDLTFKARKGGREMKADLIAQFPGEAAGIERYFSDVMKVARWFGRHYMAQSLPGVFTPLGAALRYPGRQLALTTTGEYLDRHLSDPRLKAILVSQWGDYGLPPSQSAFTIHAMIASHYFKGGYYPVGGSKTIADSVVPLVEQHGGQLLVNHEVQEVLIQNGRAVGVKVREIKGEEYIEKEYFADAVVSNAGAYLTYTRLLPADYPLSFRREVETYTPGVSTVTAYLGFKDDPRTLGLQGENYWLFSSYDHDRMFRERNRLWEGNAVAAYLSFPSLKNPLARAATAEIIGFLDYDFFRQWAGEPWQKRSADYEAVKERICEALIDFCEARLPGLRSMIDYRELSTPLSTEHFTAHREGNVYGLPAIPQRYRHSWLGTRTPVKNLYLTGADAGVHGIVGALMSGVFTAGTLMGAPHHIMKIFAAARRFRTDRS